MLHGGTPHDCIYECIVFDLQILLKNNHACSRIIKDIIDQKITVNTCLSETSETVPSIVHDLCHALSSKKTGYEFMVQGYLYHLLGTIINDHLYEQAHQNIVSAAISAVWQGVLLLIIWIITGSNVPVRCFPQKISRSGKLPSPADLMTKVTLSKHLTSTRELLLNSLWNHLFKRINTPRQTGGLLSGYKPLLPASAKRRLLLLSKISLTLLFRTHQFLWYYQNRYHIGITIKEKAS